MSGCSSSACLGCASKQTCQKTQDFSVPAHAGSHIKQVIAVMSGKGGVGKSMVTCMLAVSFARRGLKVGVLDADITGPSVLKSFGLNDVRAFGYQTGIQPLESRAGIKLMSINALLDESQDPVVWRGPVIAGIVKQFWSDVIWRELDVLLVDMPPGTGDVPLTVFQSLPVTGVVTVTTPQDLVAHIVEKAIRMAEKMQVPLLALIENFAWFDCAQCETRHYLYGRPHADELANTYGIPLYAQLPIRTDVPKLIDQGLVETMQMNAFDEFVAKLAHALLK